MSTGWGCVLMCIVICSLGRHLLTPIVTSLPWNLSPAVSTLPPPFTSVTHTSLTHRRLEHTHWFTYTHTALCLTKGNLRSDDISQVFFSPKCSTASVFKRKQLYKEKQGVERKRGREVESPRMIQSLLDFLCGLILKLNSCFTATSWQNFKCGQSFWGLKPCYIKGYYSNLLLYFSKVWRLKYRQDKKVTVQRYQDFKCLFSLSYIWKCHIRRAIRMWMW